LTIRIPPQLADAVDEDDYPERLRWLAALPGVIDEGITARPDHAHNSTASRALTTPTIVKESLTVLGSSG